MKIKNTGTILLFVRGKIIKQNLLLIAENNLIIKKLISYFQDKFFFHLFIFYILLFLILKIIGKYIIFTTRHNKKNFKFHYEQSLSLLNFPKY